MTLFTDLINYLLFEIKDLAEVNFLKSLRKSLRIGSITFIIAILVTLISTGITEFVPLSLAMLILFAVIIVGIVFDVIGVAATAADIAPLNAKAAKKIFGAKKALFLVQRADEVASFCCDIVGDVCGTLGGALGVVIVMRISQGAALHQNILQNISLALIAAITVAGKAYGKKIGIMKADEIIFTIGKIISSLGSLVGIKGKKEVKGEKGDVYPGKD